LARSQISQRSRDSPLNKATSKLLIGDWFVILTSLVVVFLLFQTLWVRDHASKIKINLGKKIIGVYDLNQNKTLQIHGAIGDATIAILNGRVRFASSPCTNQYCVHQGWLSHSGQVAICLPNQISIQLIGEKPTYDSLNY
jgi:hypothetical protein